MTKTYAFAALILIAAAPAFAEEITSDWNGVLKTTLRIRGDIAIPRYATSVTFVGGRVEADRKTIEFEYGLGSSDGESQGSSKAAL